MNFASLSPQNDNRLSLQRENHSSIKSEQTLVEQKIQPGMSPNEIAEVVSDHLISVVKKQFKKAKEKYNKATR